mgnify:CR=1 FL=1
MRGAFATDENDSGAAASDGTVKPATDKGDAPTDTRCTAGKFSDDNDTVWAAIDSGDRDKLSVDKALAAASGADESATAFAGVSDAKLTLQVAPFSANDVGFVLVPL